MGVLVCACVCLSLYRAISARHKRINQLFVASFDVVVVAVIASVVVVAAPKSAQSSTVSHSLLVGVAVG